MFYNQSQNYLLIHPTKPYFLPLSIEIRNGRVLKASQWSMSKDPVTLRKGKTMDEFKGVKWYEFKDEMSSFDQKGYTREASREQKVRRLRCVFDGMERLHATNECKRVRQL